MTLETVRSVVLADDSVMAMNIKPVPVKAVPLTSHVSAPVVETPPVTGARATAAPVVARVIRCLFRQKSDD